MADQRILAGRPATLTATLVDADGIAAAPTEPVTVHVVRADGSDVKPAGTAATVTGNDATVALTGAETADLDTLTATWTDAGGGTVTTVIDVVGRYWVSIAALRALAQLDDTTKFPNAKLVDARRWFEELAESFCRQSFVPRHARDNVDGTGTSTLKVTHPWVREVLAVEVLDTAGNPTAWSADQLDAVRPRDGRLVDVVGGTWPAGTANIVISYTHGHDAPDADLQEAALTAIRSKLLNDKTGKPALSVTNPNGTTTRFATAGADRPTGIPDVDSVLVRNRPPLVA